MVVHGVVSDSYVVLLPPHRFPCRLSERCACGWDGTASMASAPSPSSVSEKSLLEQVSFFAPLLCEQPHARVFSCACLVLSERGGGGASSVCRWYQ